MGKQRKIHSDIVAKFDSLDDNGDGFLDYKEMEKLLHYLNKGKDESEDVVREEIEEIFKQIHQASDHGGVEGKVTKQEFVTWYENVRWFEEHEDRLAKQAEEEEDIWKWPDKCG